MSADDTGARPTDTSRLRVHVRGAVQGVGYRPFVYRLAADLDLRGWVINSSTGVRVEVEGPPERVADFLRRMRRQRPPRAVVQGIEASYLEPIGLGRFAIRESQDGEKTTLVLPDIATCAECLHEICDPSDRRYRYPFTNCTHCGPRYSIIRALPYDRPNTSMAGFTMCGACQSEYRNPLDRRFHAQPNACPACGPRLALWDRDGRVLAERDDALRAAVEAVDGGRIVAVKGLGGFHLVVDAADESAVSRLRRLKAREEKPFAIMCPSIADVCRLCEVSEAEAGLLESPESPIVLLARRGSGSAVAASVAPGHPTLGIMLPYTPLHHLLIGDLHRPVVATSGNRADEPICTDEADALDRLRDLADVFLVHDRPIVRHVDDSVTRVVLGRELVIRRARGYAPLPVLLSSDVPRVLGVGAHLKNTVAVAVGRNVFVSQHIGDLETPEAAGAFERTVEALRLLYETDPDIVACDAHPDYLSTRYATSLGRSCRVVQHHLAHVLACMAENEIRPPVLGVAWDGTGYGLDGTVWGGEFFDVTASAAPRVARLRTFRLPGGDRAVREPRRSAVGVLHELLGGDGWASADLPSVAAFSAPERTLLARALSGAVNAPRTSSVGRLFDAVASLVGLRQRVRYEGQAAMELEAAIDAPEGDEAYPVAIVDAGADARPLRWVVDWGPLVRVLLADLACGVPVARVSASFHRALAAVIVDLAGRVGHEHVVLSGGCFQNRRLTEWAVGGLERAGFKPCWHQRIPPNDGGIALGQVVGVAWGLAIGGDDVSGSTGQDPQHQR